MRAEKKTPKKKNRYVKPEINKHKAVALVSGSGSGSSCNYYSSRTTSNAYYY